MVRTPLLLSALFLLTHCARTTTELGGAPEDEVKLADAPEFAHYLDTLEGARDLRVRDLYERPLSFKAAPTPRELLRRQQEQNPAPAAGARTLRLLDYNVALLDAKLFGLVPYTATPDLELRAPILFEKVLAEGYDIITFQEVWRRQDVDRLRAAAENAGYWVATSERQGATDGLAIAVKKTLAEGPTEVGAESYDVPASGLEFFPAPGLNRGFLYARFEVEGIGPVVVYDTHAAAFPDSYPDRMANVRQLGLHLRARPEEELVLLGGDMNGAPYYRKNDWTLPDGAVESVWFANTLSYPLVLHYGGLVDLAIRGRATPDEAQNDIAYGDLVPDSLDDEYCARTPVGVFTATDCNALYEEQYAGTEFPARIDFFFARDPGGRVHVSGAPVVFTGDVEYAGKQGPLSDHYGQAVTIQVAP